MKEERDGLEERMQQQAESTALKMESWQRESRLISSAMFELGVRMVDKTIQGQMMGASDRAAAVVPVPVASGGGGGGGVSTPFMSTQREALARSSLGGDAGAVNK